MGRVWPAAKGEAGMESRSDNATSDQLSTINFFSTRETRLSHRLAALWEDVWPM